MKVVYIPGILGSNLSWNVAPGLPLYRVWLDLSAVDGGALALLDLAPDGVSPGPLADGRVVQADGILATAYGPLLTYMRYQGWDVFPVGSDWRLSLLVNAARWWPPIQQWAAGQPIYFVAHSQGGLLARAIYGQMQATGQDPQLARLVTLCTPHYGSLEPVRLWWRLPLLYRALMDLVSWKAWIAGRPGPDYLDRVLASHPSWYELTSFAGVGPLFDSHPEQAAEIYTPAFYQGASPYVNANLLTQAQLVQTELASMIPLGRLVCVYGHGVQTPYQLHPPASAGTWEGYDYTLEGDGQVTAAQASQAGFRAVGVAGSHGLIPLTPYVWSLLPSLLANG